MDRQLTMVVIAALLHDIGKFAQRAGRPYSQEMKEEYLKGGKGNQGHWHTLYTDYFIEKDLPLPESLDNDRSQIARWASAHHRSEEKNHTEMILMIADCLSSGVDRGAEEDVEGLEGFRESRLGSVFDEVELANHRFEPPEKWFYDLMPLQPGSDKIFPRPSVEKGDSGDYAALFERFYTQLRTFEGMNNHQFYIEALAALLEKYSWCIPSFSNKTLPNVSLFDHSFSTASIAQALFLYHKDKGTAPSFADAEAKFLLASGDLSGIQNYIFGITRNSGKGVSKIFRARSFFLQVMTRAIVIEIQRHLGLYSVCRVLDSGGKFILLLPNNELVGNYLEKFDRDLQFWFREKFKGNVTMSLSWSTLLSHEDFKIKKFQPKLDEANEAIEARKYHKLSKSFSDLGMIINNGYDQAEAGNCMICGINAADEESVKRYSQKEGADVPICRDCCDQIVYFGTKLPKTSYLIYGTTGKVPIFRNIFLSLSEEAPQTNLDWILQVDALIDTPGFGRFRIARHLPVLEKEDLTDERWFKLFEHEIDFDVFSGQEMPMTFSMIAKKSKKKDGEKLIGRELLGFLKADVDNLGLIFNLGLGNRLSVARFTMLSRMLNLFFAEYLVELVKREFPYIYVVFAGGDDLFLVGPWWHTVRFAVELRKRFSQFCTNNPDLTLSCAVLPARSRLPMRKAAELVEFDLEKAKRTAEPGRLKDTVCFLGATMSWAELETAIELGYRFDNCMNEKQRTNFSTAFLHRLMVYHKMYRDFTEGKTIKAGRYLSLAHYDIGRNIASSKADNEEELEFLYKIFAVGVKERPELARLNIPLFFAINMNREV